MTKAYFLLLASTLSIGFLHALAPDHWMPFAMIGKAQKWSRMKVAWVAFLSGIGHVGSSILVGGIGLVLGLTLAKLRGIEGARGPIALWLLIGFGIAYAIWGLKKARRNKHTHLSEDQLRSKTITVWVLFAIFVLGPCEPLIPLMFLASQYGWWGIWVVSIIFSIVTILMMVTQSLLAFVGVQLIKHEIAERYSHAFAGLVIALTGGMVMVLGI